MVPHSAPGVSSSVVGRPYEVPPLPLLDEQEGLWTDATSSRQIELESFADYAVSLPTSAISIAGYSNAHLLTADDAERRIRFHDSNPAALQRGQYQIDSACQARQRR